MPLLLALALSLAGAPGRAELRPEEAEVPTAELPLEADVQGASADVPPPPSAATGSPAPETTAAAPADTDAPPPEPERAEAPPARPDTEESPQPPIVAAEESPARSRSQRDPEERTYARHLPAFGISLNASLRPFGDGTSRLPAGFAPSRLRGVQAAFEYQPAFLQAIGVLGVGPSFTYAQGLGSFTRQLIAPGLQARYQARFFREQMIVPMAGYEIRYVRYLFPEERGNLTAQGPFFGAMLLMNFLEPDAAADAFIEHGISRTYLIAELRSLAGSDATVNLAGRSLFFGLRFEF